MLLIFENPTSAQVTTRTTSIIIRRRMWAQETHRVPKFQKVRRSAIYMYYFNTTCSRRLMTNGAFWAHLCNV